jgi:hypothetical protein
MLNHRPSNQTIPNIRSKNPGFREAKRIQQSFLTNLEKRTLIWLAARTPAWINSDHLTLLGLLPWRLPARLTGGPLVTALA